MKKFILLIFLMSQSFFPSEKEKKEEKQKLIAACEKRQKEQGNTHNWKSGTTKENSSYPNTIAGLPANIIDWPLSK